MNPNPNPLQIQEGEAWRKPRLAIDHSRKIRLQGQNQTHITSYKLKAHLPLLIDDLVKEGKILLKQ